MLGIFRKIARLLSGSTQTVSFNGNRIKATNSQVSYNGKTYKGSSIEVSNGKVYVDGVMVDKTNNTSAVIVATTANSKNGNCQTVNIRM